MKIDNKFLTSTPLFKGISEQELTGLEACMNFDVKEFSKDEVIYMSGSSIDSLGLVLSGEVMIERYDFWGNKNIMQVVTVGDVFGESFAALKDQEILFNVIAKLDCKILFIETSKIITMCPRACSFHTKFISNLVSILARKNINLSSKIIHTGEKSIRARVMNYLSDEAFKAKSKVFTIPFNRQQMADYLQVDRSALSAELSKMKDEGLIEYRKNEFSLRKMEV